MNSNCFKLVFIAVLLVVAVRVEAQQVSPLQTGHYLPAFSNIRDMATPPPGFFVLWYNQFSTTNSYYDRNGNRLDALPLSEIDPDFPDIEFDVKLRGFATAPAFFWASNKTILGGARYMAGFVPVYFTSHADFYTELTDTQSGNVSGIADFYFAPLTLSWAKEKMDITVAYGFTAPTGRYETGSDDNIGLGFWTHQAQAFGYYYPVEDQSTAFMLGATYELNTKIKGEDFNPGNRFSLEYGISQYLTDKLEVGIQGGHNWQITQDSGSEVIFDPSILDKKSTLAFSIGYWAIPGKLQITGRYGFDYGLVQRFKVNMFMLNFAWITGALTGENRIAE